MRVIQWLCLGILVWAAAMLAHEGHGKSHAPAEAKKVRSPVAANAETIAKGKELYAQQCAACHGDNGKGQTEMAKVMPTKPTDLTAPAMAGITEGEIYWVITHGIEKSGMPPYEGKLDEAGRWQVSRFVQSLRPRAAGAKKAAKTKN